MNKEYNEYDVEYKTPEEEDWTFFNDFDTLEEAKQKIEREKERDKRNNIEFNYRIVGKKILEVVE